MKKPKASKKQAPPVTVPSKEEKRTEALLKMDLNDRRLGAEHLRDPLLVLSLDGRIFDCNDAAVNFYGYTREELLQLSVHKLRPHEAPETESSQIEQAKRQGVLFEAVHVRKDGSTVPVEVNSTHFASAGTDFVICVVRDITERKRAEDTLHRIHSRARFALEKARIGSWELDLRNHTSRRDLTHDQIFGYETLVESWTYEIFLDHVLAGDRRDVDRKFRQAIAAQCDWNFECRIRRADGEVRWIWAAGGHEKPLTRTAFRMAGIVQDITERKKASEALVKSETLYRSLFQNMMNGFAHCQMVFEEEKAVDFIYLSVNDAFGAQTGLKDVVGKKVSELIPGIRETSQPLLDLYGRVALTGKPENTELFVQALEMWFSVSAYSPAHGYFVAVFDVITGRKNAEVELKRANRVRETLIECDRALVRMTSEAELLEAICTSIVKLDSVTMAWIGFAEEDAKKTLRPVMQAGGDAEYFKRAKLTWADVPRGRGPAGTATRTRKVDQCLNLATNPRLALWREAALQRGYTSITSFPLLCEDACLGALTVYSSRVGGFNKDELQLLEPLGENIAFGIVNYRSRAERARLQKSLLQISEREKQVIARELHDGLCQNLSGLAMMSSFQHSQLAAKEWPDAKIAKEMSDLLYATLKESRDISHGLHPVGSDGEGLMIALARLAGSVCSLFRISCTFICPESVFFENETASTHLFRIAQEAVNNARKHGRADCVTIALHHAPEGLVLAIEDNGVGFPVKRFKKSGMGLDIMKHRASEIGATLSVHRAGQNGGTVVTCTLPKCQGAFALDSEIG